MIECCISYSVLSDSLFWKIPPLSNDSPLPILNYHPWHPISISILRSHLTAEVHLHVHMHSVNVITVENGKDRPRSPFLGVSELELDSAPIPIKSTEDGPTSTDPVRPNPAPAPKKAEGTRGAHSADQFHTSDLQGSAVSSTRKTAEQVERPADRKASGMKERLNRLSRTSNF